MLGAAPTKAAVLITFLALAAAALLVTGTIGLVLASGSWGTGVAIAVERSGVFGRIGCEQVAIELQVSFVLQLRLYNYIVLIDVLHGPI